MSVNLVPDRGINTPIYPRQRWDEIINLKYWFYTKNFRKSVFATDAWPILGDFLYDEAGCIERCLAIIDTLIRSHGLTSYERGVIEELFYSTTLHQDKSHEEYAFFNDQEIRAKNFLDDVLASISRFAQQSPEEVREEWYKATERKAKIMADMALKAMQSRWGVNDLDRWSEQDAWNVRETAALSLKLEPKYAFDLPKNHDRDVIENIERLLLQRVELVERASAADKFGREYINPDKAKTWFIEKGFWKPVTTRSKDCTDDDLHDNTKHKLYSLIIVLASEGFSSYFCQISREVKIDAEYLSQLCREYGVPVSEKTINKYIKEMSEWSIGKNAAFIDKEFHSKKSKGSWPARKKKLL